MMWYWWWHLAVLVLLCPKLMRQVVHHSHSKRWKIFFYQDEGVEDFVLCCDGPSLVTLLFIGVYVEVRRFCWWRIHHISMEDTFVLPDSGVGNSCINAVCLRTCGSRCRSINLANILPENLSPLCSDCIFWIETWLLNIDHHMSWPCDIFQMSGLMSWSHPCIMGKNPPPLVWLQLNV